MLAPRTHWDHLTLRPSDVPCVVELGPPPRRRAQTQPALVGTDAPSLPPAPLDSSVGPWEGALSRGGSLRSLGWSKLDESWLPQSKALPAWPAPCPALMGLVGLGGPSVLCWIDLPKW